MDQCDLTEEDIEDNIHLVTGLWSGYGVPCTPAYERSYC
jgi:hypothetical protein